jgi:hypothetical protein
MRLSPQNWMNWRTFGAPINELAASVKAASK